VDTTEWTSERQQLALAGLRTHYAHAGPELRFSSPFQLLIAVMLSAQSTDKQVNRVCDTLFTYIHNARELADIAPEQLMDMIKGVGIYKNKAQNLQKMAQMLLEFHNGEVPSTLDELEKLPGVGHKTACVVVSIAFDTPAIAVDTHVFRVSNRIGLAEAKNVTQTEKQLMEIIPKHEWSSAHHWLIHHGRYCCTARSPRCSTCPQLIHDNCRAQVQHELGLDEAKPSSRGGDEDKNNLG